jgi:predicted ATPase/DNA-binding CsgD family transcriptional regulator
VPGATDVLIGRQDELAELGQLVDAHRMVTVVGAPGVGKSRLTVEVARQAASGRLAGEWPDGVWVVDLGGLPAGTPVAAAVAATLALPARVADLRGLVDVLRSRRVLLVLDNAEHLLADCVGVIGKLIAECAGVRALVTSRVRPWQLTGAVLALAPLPTTRRPDQGSTSPDAVRLFVDRASVVAPHLDLTGQHARAVAQLCARLDGLPLAIELAARSVRLLGLDDLLAHVDAGLDLVRTEGRANGRHAGLRAALDVSYQLLDADQQLVFRRLSVLADRIDPASVRELCPPGLLTTDRIEEVLFGLADRSLLVPDGSVDHRAPGFGQLRIVRRYGQDRLREAGEAEDTYQRLAGWLAGQAQPELDLAQPAERLNDHLRTLRVAVAWAAHRQDRRAASLAAALSLGLLSAGRLTEAGVVAREALGRQDGGADRRAVLSVVAATASRWHGDLDRMAVEATEAVAGTRGEESGVAAMAANLLGLALVERKDVDSGRTALQEGLRIARAVGDTVSVGQAMHGLGRAEFVAHQEGAESSLTAAGAHLTAAEAILRAEGTPPELCAVLVSTAAVDIAVGQLDEAEERLVEALNSVRTRPEYMPSALHGLAVIAFRRGQVERGLRLATSGDAIRVRTGATRRLAGPDHQWPELDGMVWQAQGSVSEKQLTDLRAVAIRLNSAQLLAYAAGSDWSELFDRTENRRQDREMRVLGFIAQGLTNNQIARRIGVSVRTVVTDVSRISRRLNVRSRAELVTWAQENQPTA